MKIAFIGLGEVGQALQAGLTEAAGARGLPVPQFSGYDRQPERSAASSLAKALTGAELIFSVVTARQALPVAEALAEAVADGRQPALAGAFYLDGNSCAPQAKQAAAAQITAAGGRYVDCAIMAPIHPRRQATPMSLSGPDAADAQALCQRLGMATTWLGDRVGEASMTKMLRSVAVKGLEALTSELALALGAAGPEVAGRVLDSLDASYPGFDWRDKLAYHWERCTTHGIRRADEMDEVCATLDGLGVEPLTTRATARRQRQMGEGKPGYPLADLPHQG